MDTVIGAGIADRGVGWVGCQVSCPLNSMPKELSRNRNQTGLNSQVEELHAKLGMSRCYRRI